MILAYLLLSFVVLLMAFDLDTPHWHKAVEPIEKVEDSGMIEEYGLILLSPYICSEFRCADFKPLSIVFLVS